MDLSNNGAGMAWPEMMMAEFRGEAYSFGELNAGEEMWLTPPIAEPPVGSSAARRFEITPPPSPPRPSSTRQGTWARMSSRPRRGRSARRTSSAGSRPPPSPRRGREEVDS